MQYQPPYDLIITLHGKVPKYGSPLDIYTYINLSFTLKTCGLCVWHKIFFRQSYHIQETILNNLHGKYLLGRQYILPH